MESTALIKMVQGEHLKGKWKLALQMDMVCGGCCEKSYLDCRSLGIVWHVKGVGQGLRTAADIFSEFEKILEKQHIKKINTENARMVLDVKCVGEALKIIMQAAKNAGLTMEEDAWLTVDAGADALHQADSGLYFFPGATRAKCEELSNKKEEVTAQQPDTISTQINRSTAEIVEFYRKLVEKFPVLYIRNALEGKDLEGWETLEKAIGKQWERKGNDFLRR